MSGQVQEFWRNEDNTLSFLFSEHNGYANPDGPDCPICGKRILWCLDMFSFTTGNFDGNGPNKPFTLAHAECVWTKNAFDERAKLAQE